MGRVVDHYAAQLEQLHGNAPVGIAAPAFCGALTSLRVGLGGRTQRLPQINAAALRSLSLYGVGAGFSWRCFGGPVIDFADLRALDVAYDDCLLDDDDDDGGGGGGGGGARAVRDGNSGAGLELRFPRLQRLRIVGCPRNCVLLEDGVFPEFLPHARIYGPAAALALIDASRLRRLGRLDVNVQRLGAGTSHAEFHALANRVFGSRAPDDGSFLYVGRHVPIDPELVQWRRLARLLVMSPLDAAALVALVRRLPSLRSLVSFRTAVPDDDDGAALDPGCSRIERLGVIYSDACAAAAAGRLLRVLLRGAGRLRLLTLPARDVPVARAAIDQLAPLHPHVAAVALRAHV